MLHWGVLALAFIAGPYNFILKSVAVVKAADGLLHERVSQ